MITMKFGGTSLADAACIRRAAEQVRLRVTATPIVVASAMAGVTDALVEAAMLARDGDLAAATARVRELEVRHRRAAADLRRDPPGLPGPLGTYLEGIFTAARQLLHGIALLGELTPAARDALLSAGELGTSALLAAAIPEAWWMDVRDVLATDEAHGAARPDTTALADAVARRIRPLLKRGSIVVTQGFIGRSRGGRTTTLGRGGSDLSAALLAAASGSSELQIWTDVPGIQTCDPRIVPAARPVGSLTFDEAEELAALGAKVLHPATLRPVRRGAISLRILDTFHPDEPGTLVSDATDHTAGRARAMAVKKPVGVAVATRPRLRFTSGYGARLFAAFDRHDVAIHAIATSEVSIAVTADDTPAFERAVTEVRRFAAVEVEHDKALITVVGHRLRHRPGIADRVFGSVGDVPIAMISLGGSTRSLSFVIDAAHVERCADHLHTGLFDERDLPSTGGAV